MIKDNDRLIIILGMAHSGTTILSYLLNQHPSIVTAKNGSEEWIFENSWLPNREKEPIEEILSNNPGKRVLLKRPWTEVYHSDWQLEEMPYSKYIYSWRDIEKTSESWSKPDSLVSQELRESCFEHHRAVYSRCWEAARKFREHAKFFKSLYHPNLLNNPNEEMKKINNWLGLENFEYDVSKVSKEINIKRVLLNLE